MKNESKPTTWPEIEACLRGEAKRDAMKFPPFLHQRIMAAIHAEAENKSRSTPSLAKAWRWVFAGGLASVALALALRPSPVPEPTAASAKVSEWIIMAANSDDQMATLISDRVLNRMVNTPYQQQLDSLSNELESAIDFTLRLMPIEVALR
ncbi:MAG TPA: hypothetical protein QGH16_04240 [Verrucomicrobiota bacterium]|jgi:hypothetical protein|nr:hypothetical protein [Verrucomicrobiota bacterium]